MNGVSPKMISVIVPTKSNLLLLKQCIKSLRRCHIADEIVVVDNGDEGAGRWARRNGCEVVYTDNASFAKSCNLGVLASQGTHILLCNDDIQFMGNIPYATKDITGYRLVYPNGLLQHGSIGFDMNGNPYHLWHLAPQEHPEAIKSYPVPAVTFALAMIRRGVWDELGGLDESYVNAYEDIDFCAVQGTPVITKSKVVPIEKITVGDHVLTANGGYHTVSETMQRPFKGVICGIKPWFGETIWVTANHPIKTPNGWKPAGTLSANDWVWSPATPFEAEIQNVYLRSRIRMTGNKSHGQKRGYISFAGQHANAKSRQLPSAVRITKGFARLMGYYLAEGSSDRHNLTFSFHREEIEYISDVKSLMQTCFGMQGSEYLAAKGKGMRINYASKALCLFFANLLGDGAHAKHLPDFSARLTRGQRVELLKGYWRGDGCKKPRISMSTVSSVLSLQIVMLAASCGFMFSSRPRPNGGHPCYVINLSQYQESEFRQLLGIEEKARPPKQGIFQKPYFRADIGGFWIAIRQTTKVDASMQVYNLSIPTEQSYTLGRIATHNCLRAREAGFMTWYSGKNSAIHLTGQTAGRNDHVAESWQHFGEKWLADGRLYRTLGCWPVERGA